MQIMNGNGLDRNHVEENWPRNNWIQMVNFNDHGYSLTKSLNVKHNVTEYNH